MQTKYLLLTLPFSLIIYSCLDSDHETEVHQDPTHKESQTTIDSLEYLEDLGEKLFFEPMLSLDESIHCGSCHIPEYAFADIIPFSRGVGGTFGKRNTPSAMNLSGRPELFYDGRASSLEDQVHFPIEDPLEMNVKMETVVERLKNDQKYVLWFDLFFEDGITQSNIASAIAEYERTLETGNAKIDQVAREEAEFTESEQRGQEIFNDPKNKCFDCHLGVDFTNDEYRNIGLYDGVERNDLGRFNVTNDSADIGKFRVPVLRNVAMTAPYMHDGSFQTLEEVVDYYNNPYDFVPNPVNIDSLLLEPLNLSDQDKVDLVNFLKTLTDEQFVNVDNF